MYFQVVIVSVVAALAAVLAYLTIGRVLPIRWRARDVEQSEDSTLDSVNVLSGLLPPIVLAFVVAGVLADYDNARSTHNKKLMPSARYTASPTASPTPPSRSGNATAETTRPWSSNRTGRDAKQQSSDAAWTTLNTFRDDIYSFSAADERQQSLQDKAIDKVQEIYDTRRARVDPSMGRPGLPVVHPPQRSGNGRSIPTTHPTASNLPTLNRCRNQDAVLASALYLVTMLNHAFAGAHRVKSSAFEILLSRLNASP